MLIAALDDYQRVARDYADWSRLEGHEVVFLHEPLGDVDDAARELHPFEIVCAMRERTAFPAELLERLPNLRLLVTTGMRNASIDLDAAGRRGVTVCGTEAAGVPTAELAWGLILALVRHIPAEDERIREGERRESEKDGRAAEARAPHRSSDATTRPGCAPG